MVNDPLKLSRHHYEGPGDQPRRLIPDTPLVAGITAAVTLALAVVLFLAAMPSEERVLIYQGDEVSPAELCETTQADGDTVLGACAELGRWETRKSGWGVVQLVFAALLTAGAAVVIGGIPKQVRERRERRQAEVDRLAGEDFPRL